MTAAPSSRRALRSRLAFGAAAGLLADRALAARLDAISRRLRAASGTETAADAIESVLRAAPVA